MQGLCVFTYDRKILPQVWTSPPTPQLNRNDPYTLEDYVYFNAVWLSQEYGGKILEWIRMTLVLGQDKIGAPQLGLANEWIEARKKNTKNSMNTPLHSEEALRLPESQDSAPTILSRQNIGVPTEEQKLSNPSHGVYWISYLHRTAKDFLEKRQNWSRITMPTLKSEFDPYVAILMASLFKLKTQPTENVYDTGVAFLRMVRELKLTPSGTLIKVIEEYDRVLNIRCEEHGGNPHWSRGDPKWKGPRPDWGDDLDSIAIQSGLTWIVNAREAHNTLSTHHARQANLPLPFFNMVNRPGLPLIAYTILFQNWALRDRENALGYPSPGVETLNQLLDMGFDPNECFKGYTIWEYALHLVHTYRDLLYQESKLECWLDVFKVMLLHGADPHAYCLHDPDYFKRVIGLADESSLESEKRAREHLRSDPRERTRRGSDASAWDDEDTHPYHHSVTAIVADVFSTRNCPGTKDLKGILEAPKKEVFETLEIEGQ